MNETKHYYNIWTFFTISCLIFFLIFFLYPISTIFSESVISNETGKLSLDAFSKFFKKKYYTSTILNSLSVTTVATFITMIIGSLLAYLMKTVKIKGKKIIDVILLVSILSPPFIGAYSWIILLGRVGIITKFINSTFGLHYDGIYGFDGILLVFVVKMVPLMCIFVSGALKKLDSSLIECSENLGCTGIKKMFRIVIPLILPTVLSSSFLVFMRIFCDFGTPMLIGEGYRTIPVLIYNSFVGEASLDHSFAAAVSVIVIVFSAAIFIGQQQITKRTTIEMNSLNPIQPIKKKGIYNIFAHLFTYIISLMAIVPLIVIVIQSFKNTDGIIFYKGFSFDSYLMAFKNVGNAIANTFVYSFIAMLFILVIGVLFSYVSVRKSNKLTEILDVIITIPYIIPGSVLGIALILGFNRRPIVLTGTVVIMVIAFIIRRITYTIRSSSSILKQMDPSLEEAGMSLGANPMKAFWKVTFPVMIPGVISGALISWMSIITELSSTVLLYNNRTQTMSIAIYQEVIRGNQGVACALTTILLITTVIGLSLFFKVSGKKEIEL